MAKVKIVKQKKINRKKPQIKYNNNIDQNKDMKMFIKMVSLIVGSFCVVAIIASFFYISYANEAAKPYLAHTLQNANANEIDVVGVSDAEDPLNTAEEMFKAPRKTNVLICGIDDEASLSDVTIVLSFDSVTGKISLISMPRDTKVVMSKGLISRLQKAGRRPPSSGVMKLNAVHSYAGKELGAEFMQAQVEEMLNISINYNIELGLDAFKSIVDAVGGVDMEIPSGGLRYSDPEQGLKINVPEGMVHLDGNMAEGVVRYRATYRGGDLQRIGVQQEFLKLLFKQVLNKDKFVQNAPALISTVLSYVKTDFPLTDVPKYAKYLTLIKAENFYTVMLPGATQTGSPYFHMDEEKTKEMVNEIFYNTDIPIIPAAEELLSTINGGQLSESVDKSALKIQVLNGGIVEGLANKKKSMLEDNGFKVANVGTYTGTKNVNTKIYVRDQKNLEVLAKYFDNADCEIDETIPTTYDIVVILGKNES